MTGAPSFRDDLVANLPALRQFALGISQKADRADDLVQQTALKAMIAEHQFRAGTNLQGWLRTILRNEFYAHLRKAKREVEDPDQFYAARVTVEIDEYLYAEELKRAEAAIDRLPEPLAIVLREAVDGASYEDIAQRHGIAKVTARTRVFRARQRLLAQFSACGRVGP
jgi:RNA polymerase sigma-70 factor (ECF subfamily)